MMAEKRDPAALAGGGFGGAHGEEWHFAVGRFCCFGFPSCFGVRH